jgi:hypothetical protein
MLTSGPYVTLRRCLPRRYVGAWWGLCGKVRAELEHLMLSGVPIMWFECLRNCRRVGRNLPGSVIDP